MDRSGDFAGRSVVVTGGTGALGSAVVGMLLERGAQVHVPCFAERELAYFPHASTSGVHVKLGLDLSDEAAVSAYYGAIPALWASLQIAGGFAIAPFEETPLAQLESLFKTNVATCFLACREATKRIRATGDGGRLVNVAARPALVPTGGLSAYSATKAAVAGLTLSLAEELRDHGIWVNAVVPSTMDTPANRSSMPHADFTKWPKVTEVAETMVFLASPLNGVTRGALVPVYGKS